MMMNRPTGPRPGQPMNQNPLANPATPHSMNPNAVGPAAAAVRPNPGGVPSGMRGLPQGITPEMLQNPQFLQLLQQLQMQQQQTAGMGGGFSRSLFGR